MCNLSLKNPMNTNDNTNNNKIEPSFPKRLLVLGAAQNTLRGWLIYCSWQPNEVGAAIIPHFTGRGAEIIN